MINTVISLDACYENKTKGGSLMQTTVMVQNMIRHIFSPHNHMVYHGGLFVI